jgi:hypothetical protein
VDDLIARSQGARFAALACFALAVFLVAGVGLRVLHQTLLRSGNAPQLLELGPGSGAKMNDTSKKVEIRLGLFDEFLGKLVSDLGEIEVPDGKRVFTGCLLCRIASNLIAARRLLNYQHHVLEADMLVRSALEALFWLGALIEDEGFINSILADHDHRLKQRAKLKLNIPADILHVSSAEREALNKKNRRDRRERKQTSES